MTHVREKPYGEISVVFPAYNEEANLPETIHRTLDALSDLFDHFEVIVVDDASTDRTAEMLAKFAERHSEIKVLQNDCNQGAGASMLRGMQEAKCDLVINNAIDYPFDLRDLDKLCAQLDSADVVVAARDGRPGYSLYRHLLSIGNRLLLRILFRLPVSDCNFVQLYRRSVLESIDFDSRMRASCPRRCSSVLAIVDTGPPK